MKRLIEILSLDAVRSTQYGNHIPKPGGDGNSHILQGNTSVARFHDRMPVLLQREELEPWIFSDKTFDRLLDKQMPELKHWQEFERMTLF
jgi:hypothetical protein